MSTIVVYGASDQGRCTIDAVEREGSHRIVGVIDDTVEPGTEVYGHRVLGPGADVVALRAAHGFDAAIVAIGDNATRARVVAQIEALDPTLTFATTVDPSAVLGRAVSLGAGTVILAGAVVNGSTTVGRHALLCVRSSLDHDSTLGDFASLAPGATTGGRVTIGSHTAIGLGAAIIHGITVGEHTVVGAGSTVVRSIGGHVVAHGSPCRVIRSRQAGDPYL